MTAIVRGGKWSSIEPHSLSIALLDWTIKQKRQNRNMGYVCVFALSVKCEASHNNTVEPLLSGLLRCGHLPLPDIIKNRVVFVLFVFVKSIWAGHPVWTRAWRLSHYSVLHYIVYVSMASTTRRKRSMLTLEKKLEIIGELKKGKSLRCVSGLYVVLKSTVVSHSQTL